LNTILTWLIGWVVEQELLLLRLMTPVAKFYTGKMAVATISEVQQNRFSPDPIKGSRRFPWIRIDSSGSKNNKIRRKKIFLFYQIPFWVPYVCLKPFNKIGRKNAKF
jgi:hypothetical protein